MAYCIYLRKSRADMEAEDRGEGETFARHQKMLLKLADHQKLAICEIYREIVSGETIAARPVMQRLLSEVEQGIWSGVLVMEVERLARGDTIDQGIVAQAFKYSDTKIITPLKTYDPGNEYDEEYFEFGLFMSRREYKTINRRLQRGRLAASTEGKYIGPFAPYGYQKIKLEGKQGYSLLPHPEQAAIVRLIFALFTNGERQSDGSFCCLSTAAISRKLNEMPIPAAKGGVWSSASVRSILQNPVYVGKIRWNYRPTVKKVVSGQLRRIRPRAKECLISQGVHPALITEDTWEKVQQYLSSRKKSPGKPKIQNPLAGLVVCGICGKKMVRRPHGGRYPDSLICPTLACPTVSSSLALVEDKILLTLEQWLHQYHFQMPDQSQPQANIEEQAYQKTLLSSDQKIKRLEKQINNAHDLLEQKIYSPEVFIKRIGQLNSELAQANYSRLNLLEKIQPQNLPVAPQVNTFTIEQVLGTYRHCDSVERKNILLKSILDKVVYFKNKSGRWHNMPEEFIIQIYPRFPATRQGK